MCCGGRRRRIKATCAAHVAKKTRVCVCVIPRGKEEVPRGLPAARVPGDTRKATAGVRDDGQRQDAEKRKSPGGRPRAAPLVPGDRGGNNGREVRHNPRRGQTQKKRPAEGRGAGSRAPGAHTRSCEAAHPEAAHTADTPRGRRHGPPTHPDTPLTHPPHALTHPTPTPRTHPPSRAPDTPRPPPVRDRAQ